MESPYQHPDARNTEKLNVMMWGNIRDRLPDTIFNLDNNVYPF